MRVAAWLLLAGALALPVTAAEDPPSPDPSDLINALLTGPLLTNTGAELQPRCGGPA